MRPAANRGPLGVALCRCIIAALGLTAGRLHADVLEFGPTGPVWVAGPLAAATSAVSAQDHAATSPVSSPPAPGLAGDPLTVVDAAAGPAAWRNHVGALAAKYDISPALLEALVWQESRWNAAAVSPAGARGLAQLMPGTSRELGVDWRDPSANLEGGARYLRMQLDRFDGNVEKALAAYNAGPGRVERAGGIPAIRETRNYVASIMARLSQPVRR